MDPSSQFDLLATPSQLPAASTGANWQRNAGRTSGAAQVGLAIMNLFMSSADKLYTLTLDLHAHKNASAIGKNRLLSLLQASLSAADMPGTQNE